MIFLIHTTNLFFSQAKAFLSKHSSSSSSSSSGGGGDAAGAGAGAVAAAAAPAGKEDDVSAAPSAPPALDGGASVDNIADGEASRALADTEAFLPVLAELSSLSNVSYTPVRLSAGGSCRSLLLCCTRFLLFQRRRVSVGVDSFCEV